MRHAAFVGARRCLARPRHQARRFDVANTSRPTRSADQPSARLHDRPAVNGFSPGRSLPTAPAAMVAAPPHPLASICRPWRAGRVRHRLTPTKRGRSPDPSRPCGALVLDCANLCRGEAPPRPPAPHGAATSVADTSRTTRTADQPSARIYDRPAVNGRAQSPSRLKPADPYGACTTPIDPGTWAPHSPLQGACGLSPGLQPRAFATNRPRRGHHRTAAPIGMRCRPCRAGGSGTA
jgi:hypothetical protein